LDIDIFQIARFGETSELEKLQKMGVDFNTTDKYGENISA
jgi:hypothetical protein